MGIAGFGLLEGTYKECFKLTLNLEKSGIMLKYITVCFRDALEILKCCVTVFRVVKVSSHACMKIF